MQRKMPIACKLRLSKIHHKAIITFYYYDLSKCTASYVR